MFWPDEWRGTLALVLGVGTMIALIILSAGLVLVAVTSHELKLVSVALASLLVGLGLGVLLTWLVMREANEARETSNVAESAEEARVTPLPSAAG
jgi:hypothetical protein